MQWVLILQLSLLGKDALLKYSGTILETNMEHVELVGVGVPSAKGIVFKIY